MYQNNSGDKMNFDDRTIRIIHIVITSFLPLIKGGIGIYCPPYIVSFTLGLILALSYSFSTNIKI